MRRFQYVEPAEDGFSPVTYAYTEEEILWEYWFYWSKRMKEADKEGQINIQNCIEDWIVTHWASEIV